MKTFYLLILFMSMSSLVVANNADEGTNTTSSPEWETVVWTAEDGVFPATDLDIDFQKDSIIISTTGDKFITRINALQQVDIDFSQTATPDTPVLAPSLNRNTREGRDLWMGKATRVALSGSEKVIKELTVVMANEAALKADSVITLSHKTIELKPGERIMLAAEYTLEGVPQREVTWSIDNEEVATIDNTGWLAAVKEGTAIVTAVTTDGRNLSASCEIIVKKSFIQGDVNNDGKIAVNDIVLTINAILGQTPEGFNASAADMNSDGKIQVNDVVMMVNVVLGISSSPANVRQSLNFIESLTKESFIE